MKKTSVEKEVLKIIRSRWEKGRKTYGEGIKVGQNPNVKAWLNEAIEEAADMLQYLVAARMELENETK